MENFKNEYKENETYLSAQLSLRFYGLIKIKVWVRVRFRSSFN